MRFQRRWFRTCFILPIICLIVVFFLAYKLYDWNRDIEWSGWEHSTASFSHHLCVLVPFRNREDELVKFVPHLKNFLLDQGIENEIIVLNQTDSFRFNRASLINVGWFESDRIGCDYVVMHDVDLLPLNKELDYSYPGDGVVRHISAPEYHPKYNYAKFIGGILMLTTLDFKKVNGMSNKYWGWGLEDDEFYLRIRDASFRIDRPFGLDTDRKTTFLHIHGSNRKRDYTKKSKKTESERAEKRKRDKYGGLSTIRYRIGNRSRLLYDSFPISILHIQLECDIDKYSYCLP